MEFRILGPLEVVTGDSDPVDVGTPKQRAVLTMLAAQPGRTVSVQRLVEELWADEPPERATASLQAYVSRLRRALEPGRTSRDRSAVLVSRAPGYFLAVPDEAVDATRFAAAVAAARSDGPSEATVQSLTAALQLWRGDPLPELGDSPLARAERARLQELRFSAIEERSAALLALDRPAEVVFASESILAEAPYRERVWGQLMLALYRTGRRAEALATYGRARTRLLEELGIEPGPALQDLAEALHKGPSAAQPTVPPKRRRPDVPEVPEQAADSELVGRAAELATVERLLGEPARGALLLVSGSPGIGKSALLDHLAKRAAEQGAAVGAGTGVDGVPPPVFLPWAQILRGLAGNDRQGLTEAFAPHGNLPAVLDPTLAEQLPLPAPERLADAELARSRLYQGLVDGLRRLAERRHVVIVVDDAHWLDAPSTVLLTMIAEPGSRALVAVGYREAELAADAPFAKALGELVAQTHAVHLPLQGLERADVAALARRAAGAGVPDETVGVLVDRTGGNPFFLVELLQVLAAEHALDPDAARDRVPVRVQEVVRRRLARLPEQANAVLAVASVLGRDFDVTVLREMTGIDELDLYDTLDTALVSGILTESDPGRLRFSHDLVRETAYLDQGPLRRARLHARAAKALAGPTEQAAHLRLALPVVSPLDVARAMAAAAGEAYDRTAHDTARALLHEAVDTLGRAAVTEERDVLELDLRVRLAYLHQTIDGYLEPPVAEQFERMGPLLRRTRPSVAILPALWGYASFHTASGNHDRAVEVARSAGCAEPWARIVADVHEGHAAWTAVDLPGSRRLFERAIEALPAEDLPLFPIVHWDPVAGIRGPLALICAMLGDDDAARAHLRAIAPRQEPFQRMYVSHYAAIVAVERADPATAASLSRQSLALAERGGNPEYRAFSQIHLGWAEAASGAPDGVARIEAGLAALGDNAWRRPRLFVLHADALLATGSHQRAAEVAGSVLDRGVTGEGRYMLADLHRIRGDRREAERLAREIGYAAALRRVTEG
ncbi:BTAD domain-containing putative transcriptional regulator [Dactylosporangium sp. AC04546]|uniref:BTAD domain-containing putative transcriptional regulator n=1 Tax=Dactylosporangium sp. AC04546 TaxID=2862460 RepID=UPI002E7C20F6|nr:BTAD domain-containing putative transcriptional regulator [Dactylosporangium sp. AC04546]WVK85641.1 BTAD domain-containing putative transcriptional regulator [Dactylosporangium sp. AC04546]